MTSEKNTSLSTSVNGPIERKQNYQECIPVGCVPSAAVAISPAMHAPCYTCPLPHITLPLPCTLPPPCMAPTPFHACHPPCTPNATHASTTTHDSTTTHALFHQAHPLLTMHAPPRGQNSWHTLVITVPSGILTWAELPPLFRKVDPVTKIPLNFLFSIIIKHDKQEF